MFSFPDSGYTSGHFAAEGGHPNCLHCFLMHEGQLDILNAKGDSLSDTAKKAGHAILMEKSGASSIHEDIKKKS